MKLSAFFTKILLYLFLVVLIGISFYALQKNDVRILTVAAIAFFFLLLTSFSRKVFDKSNFKRGAITQRVGLLLNISFFTLFELSIILLHFNLYSRPLEYFIIISCMAAIAFAEFVYGERSYWPLLHTILLTLNFWLGLQYTFPSLMGGDIPYLFGCIKLGLETGHLSISDVALNQDLIQYVAFPVWSIACIAHMLIIGSGYKGAIATSLIIPLGIIVPLSLYAIGRNLRIDGLGAAAIIVCVFPPFVWYICQPAPFSYGVMLFIVISTIFLMKKQRALIPLLIPVIIMVGFTHPLAASITLLLMIFLFSSSFLINKFFNKKVAYPPLTLAVVVVLSIWVFYAWYINWLAWGIINVLDLLKNLLGISSSELLTSISTSGQGLLYVITEVLFSLSLALIVGLWLGGAVVIRRTGMLFKFNSESERTFNWFFIATTPFILFMYAINFVGASGVISYRWLGVAALLSSPSIIILIVCFHFQKRDMLIKCALFFLLILLMVTNPLSNMDNPFYGDRDTVRWAYTTLETSAMDVIYSHMNLSNIITDHSYTAYNRMLPFVLENPKKDNNEKVVILRDYIFNRAFYVPVNQGESTKIGSMDTQDKKIIQNDLQKMDMIYFNGDVKVVRLGDKYPYWIKKYFAEGSPVFGWP